MADHITDKAVTVDSLIDLHARKLALIYANRTVGDHTFTGALAEFLAAALPVLNTTPDAQPDLVMGTKPDGSPWVVSAEFARSDVRVDGHGALRLHGKAISPAAAHKLATGLLSAIAWLENDGAAKAEAAASLRGEQG